MRIYTSSVSDSINSVLIHLIGIKKMKRYSLSICKLHSLYKADFKDEYDTLDEVKAMLEELINDSIAEGLYIDKKDY